MILFLYANHITWLKNKTQKFYTIKFHKSTYTHLKICFVQFGTTQSFARHVHINKGVELKISLFSISRMKHLMYCRRGCFTTWFGAVVLWGGALESSQAPLPHCH